MSKSIQDITVNDLLPLSVSDDKTISSLASALSTELTTITNAVNQILFYPNIEELPEDIIDLLAEQFQVAFYDILGLDLATKRELVEKSIVWNKKKGTKAVMQEMLKTLYNSEALVQEWFEYGGEPYTFRIFIDNIRLQEGDIENVLMIVNELKNVRSHLESITVKLTVKGTLYQGGILKRSRRQKIKAGEENG